MRRVSAPEMGVRRQSFVIRCWAAARRPSVPHGSGDGLAVRVAADGVRRRRFSCKFDHRSWHADCGRSARAGLKAAEQHFAGIQLVDSLTRTTCGGGRSRVS